MIENDIFIWIYLDCVSL